MFATYMCISLFILIFFVRTGQIVFGTFIIGILGIIFGIAYRINEKIKTKKIEVSSINDLKLRPHDEHYIKGVISSEKIIKAIYNEIDCICSQVEIQPMNKDFIPPIITITPGDFEIKIDGKDYYLSSPEKIDGELIYSLPTNIDSDEGKKFEIIRYKDVKTYMISENILRNNSTVIVKGYPIIDDNVLIGFSGNEIISDYDKKFDYKISKIKLLGNMAIFASLAITCFSLVLML